MSSSKNIFFISDTHFGHENLYDFVDDKGDPARFPHDNALDCDALMVENWNKVVKPGDRVYHLGDVAIKKAHLPTMAKLNGRKVLIRGNHDIFELKEYAKYFDDVRGTHKIENIILSHYPIHKGSIPGWATANVHGHTHLRDVRQYFFGFKTPFLDTFYHNMSVERINYTPMAYEDLRTKISLSNHE